MPLSRFFHRILFLSTLLAVFSLVSAGHGQNPPPVKPNPQAPTIAVAVPLGMQRGTTLDLTLTGTNLAEPTALWTSFPAKVTIPKDNKNGTDQTKLLVHLEVPKDAPIGFHAIRLTTTRGLSNFRIFCIDDLPQVMEVDSNHSITSAQTVPIPSVVVGRADAEVTDYSSFRSKQVSGSALKFWGGVWEAHSIRRFLCTMSEAGMNFQMPTAMMLLVSRPIRVSLTLSRKLGSTSLRFGMSCIEADRIFGIGCASAISPVPRRQFLWRSSAAQRPPLIFRGPQSMASHP